VAEYSYTVLFEPIPEGGYNVVVPALPEICTFGETLEEAREMAVDAIKCVLESMQKDNEPIPSDIDPAREKLAVTLP
jgi:predicted RNase H-like HicB family nuclease